MPAIVLILCLLAGSTAVSAQSLPRVPSNIPGGTKLQSLPKTPKQALNQARSEEIQQLMQQAVTSEDPEEQARVYTKILLLDPNNAVAYQGRKDALARLEQSQTEAELAEQQEQAAIEESLSREIERREALQRAEAAFLADDLATAERELAIARNAAPNDAEVQRLDALLQQRQAERRRLRYILIGAGIAVAVVLLVWIVIRIRRRDPYVEIVNGHERGKRIPFDGDVAKIGAVPEDGGDSNDVVVTDLDRMVSRFHCEIHRRGKRYYIVDVGSANGTYLNGRALTPGKPVRLKRGTRIDLARTCVVRLGFERRNA